jgi:hypothetical protein
MPTDPGPPEDQSQRPTDVVDVGETRRAAALPVACCHCGRVRTPDGWALPPEPLPPPVSHTICPAGLREHYPDHAEDVLGPGP